MSNEKRNINGWICDTNGICAYSEMLLCSGIDNEVMCFVEMFGNLSHRSLPDAAKTKMKKKITRNQEPKYVKEEKGN